MIIFKDHAMMGEKRITLYEAACLMARSLQPMYEAMCDEDGYTHYDLAMALKYNVIDVSIDGEEVETDS